MRGKAFCTVIVVFVCSGWLTPAADGAEPSPGEALAMRAHGLAERERSRALEALPLAERARFFQALLVTDLVALGRQGLSGLGIYQARLTREERVGDRVHGPDQVEVTVREKPLAVRLDFVAGPHKGRRALYDSKARPKEMLARESGVLGMFSVWLPVDSGLARRDTNHTITEIGFGAMIETMQAEQAKAAAAGGYTRTDEGFDARGLYCMLFTAPSGAHGLYAHKLRYCVEGVRVLPMRIEVFDTRGRREFVEYHDLRPHQPLGDACFSAQAAGL
jgi:hypothetical protein